MADLLPTIPCDVMFEILGWLPVKSLLCCKSVCKDWYNLINTSTFVEHHLKQSINNSHHLCHRQRPFVFASRKSLYLGEDIDFPKKLIELKLLFKDNENALLEYDDAHIIGLCNGLVCLRLGSTPKYFAICNPLTRTCKVVASHGEDMGHNLWYPVYGFGYDTQTDDYKIVVITMGGDRQIWIYSFKKNSWKKGSSDRLHQSPFQQNIYHNQLAYGIFGHGMLHCIVRGVEDAIRAILESVDDDFMYKELPQILRFNFSSEDWEEDLSFPNLSNNLSEYMYVEARILDGFFCIATYDLWEKLNIWIMKEYGVEKSWTKLYNCDLSSYNLIAFSRTRPNGLWFNTRSQGLVWYEPKQETKELFEYDSPFKNVFHYEVTLCGQSLVSIPRSSYMTREEFQAEVQR